MSTLEVLTDMEKELNKIERELKIRGMSRRTVKSYMQALKSYFTWKKADFSHLDEENIRDFLLHEAERRCSASTRSLILNAIKFYYRGVVRCEQDINIRSPKKHHKLPLIFSLY